MSQGICLQQVLFRFINLLGPWCLQQTLTYSMKEFEIESTYWMKAFQLESGFFMNKVHSQVYYSFLEFLEWEIKGISNWIYVCLLLLLGPVFKPSKNLSSTYLCTFYHEWKIKHWEIEPTTFQLKRRCCTLEILAIQIIKYSRKLSIFSWLVSIESMTTTYMGLCANYQENFLVCIWKCRPPVFFVMQEKSSHFAYIYGLAPRNFHAKLFFLLQHFFFVA